MNADAEVARSGRRLDLDWLRITAFGLLILYHAGLLYGPWPYHAKSRHAVPALEPLLLAINPWRLLLLFLISGVATRFMSATVPPARLLARRSLRLLVPLALGIAVIVPPQSYVQAVEQFGYREGFWHFYAADYLGASGRVCDANRCLRLPTWNHLWFVLYLWVYTAALVAATALPRVVRDAIHRAAALALAGPGVLVTPMVLLVAARVLLLPAYPPNLALARDWYDHAIYGGIFLVGYAVARESAAWAMLHRWRWAALLVASLAAPEVTGVAARMPGLSKILHAAEPVVVALYAWSVIVALCGFGVRWLPRRDGPARRYLTEAVLPFYIVHQTALVLASYWLRDLGWPVAVEAGCILAITAASCLATYEVVRRVPWLRPLFGLKLRATPEGA